MRHLLWRDLKQLDRALQEMNDLRDQANRLRSRPVERARLFKRSAELAAKIVKASGSIAELHANLSWRCESYDGSDDSFMEAFSEYA